MTATLVENDDLGTVKVGLFIPCYIDAFFPESSGAFLSGMGFSAPRPAWTAE